MQAVLSVCPLLQYSGITPVFSKIADIKIAGKLGNFKMNEPQLPEFLSHASHTSKTRSNLMYNEGYKGLQ